MQFLMSTAALPMVAKPVYGIISDYVYNNLEEQLGVINLKDLKRP
jgi:hypothetical protein